MLNKQQIIDLKDSRKFRFLLAAIVFSSLLPVFLNDPFMIHVLTLITIFTIYTSSWNLFANSGQGSLGHAAFLGIGGFTSSLLAINLGIPPIIGIFMGAIFSAGIGFLIGLTCVRLEAWFLAMVTFGFSVIAGTLVSQFDEVTHGVMGFRTPLLVPSGLPFYYFALIMAITSVIIIYFLMKSKIGLAFRAIKENSSEASMIGINTAKYKLYAFVISTFFAGLAGSLYAHFLRYISVSVFSAENSFKPLMMAVIGGLGTIEGPIIGSFMLVYIDSFLPNIDKFLQPIISPLFPAVSNVGPPLRFIGLGLFLLLIVIFFPKGVTSFIRRFYNYLIKVFRD
ncbi:MAG TPA: branched-chain amino acid ABC transporter permease [Candidatus Glassbacteria bacterium]|nr:branched-chain amino acid ABC transporter permease [Candidatus Glassbacteria bacterium]